MSSEPLLLFLRSTGLPWWILAVGYASFNITVDISLCALTGGKTKLERYFQDRLWFVWPVVVLGGGTALYLFVDALSRRLVDAVGALSGAAVASIVPISFWPRSSLFVLLCAAAIGISSRRRYWRERQDLWFSRPRAFGVLRTILFDIPLSYVLLSAVILLAITWLAMHSFLRESGELPGIRYFHPDGLYGLREVRDVFVTAAFLTLIASFLPSVMLLRESSQKSSWMYKALVVGGLLCGAIVVGFVVGAFNSRVKSIREDGLAQFSAGVEVGQEAAGEEPLLRSILDAQRTQLLLMSPSGLEVPPSLKWLVSFRGLLFGLEVMGIWGSRLGLPDVPRRLRSALKALT